MYDQEVKPAYATQGQASVPTTKRAPEIQEKMAVAQKLLSELNEEVMGLNGTFGFVLRPRTPQEADSAKNAPNHTEAGNYFDSLISTTAGILSEVRSLRDRCEL